MRVTWLGALAVATLSLSSCGGQPASRTPADGSESASGSMSSSTSSAAPGRNRSSPSTRTSTPSLPRCKTAGLRVTVSGGEGAAGSTYYNVVLTNTSSVPCRTGGFGGVSLVATASGAPIGAPAVRSKQSTARSLTLQPGQQARAVLRMANADNYPATRCRPTPAEGLRVYPPNETHYAFVALPSTACRNAVVRLLTLTPYHSHRS